VTSFSVDAGFSLPVRAQESRCLRSGFRAPEHIYPLTVFPGLCASLCLLCARCALLRFFIIPASILPVSVFGPGVKKFDFSRARSSISAPAWQSRTGNFSLAVLVTGEGFSWFWSSLSCFDFLRGLLGPIDFLRAPPRFSPACPLCVTPELFFAGSGSNPRLLFPLDSCSVFVFPLVDSICTVRFPLKVLSSVQGPVTSCAVCLEFCLPAQSSRPFSQDLVFAAAPWKFILCCEFWLRSQGWAFVFCCSVSYMISV
jgi:hypothetical protein